MMRRYHVNHCFHGFTDKPVSRLDCNVNTVQLIRITRMIRQVNRH